MQGIQDKYGADRVAVLLVSVDLGYGGPPVETIKRNQQLLRAKGISWPNALARQGWEGVVERFNRFGYGIAVIDQGGTVRSAQAPPGGLEEIVRRCLQKEKRDGTQEK